MEEKHGVGCETIKTEEEIHFHEAKLLAAVSDEITEDVRERYDTSGILELLKSASRKELVGFLSPERRKEFEEIESE